MLNSIIRHYYVGFIQIFDKIALIMLIISFFTELPSDKNQHMFAGEKEYEFVML
jgi:hypothetical protein